MELNLRSDNSKTWLAAAAFVAAVAVTGLPEKQENVRVIPAESSISIIEEKPNAVEIVPQLPLQK